jgi:hypothetical protein
MGRGSNEMKKKRIAKTAQINFDKPINQEQFGLMIGIPQQTVSKLVQFCVLAPGGSAKTWMQQYIRFQLGRIYQKKGWQGVAIAMGEGEQSRNNGNSGYDEEPL